MAYVDSSVGNQLAGARSQQSQQSQDQGPDVSVRPGDDELTESEEEASQEGPPGSLIDNLLDQIDRPNLADDLSDQTLNTIGMLVSREYDVDERSRIEWKEKADDAQKFANQEAEIKQYPWPQASNVIYPLITSAAIQFAARTYPAIVQNRNVVKGIVWGSDNGTPALGPDGKPMQDPQNPGQPLWVEPPGGKRARADRIAGHMSYQLLEEMPEWEPQVDTLLHMIPIVGGAARKSYYDPIKRRNCSVLVPLVNLVWNRWSKSFEDATRHTEILTLYPLEIEELIRLGLFLDHEIGTPDAEGAEATDEDAGHLYLEQHRTYDLDGDGYPEPYIVTIHKQSSRVVRVVARYDEEGIHADVEEDSGEERILSIDPVEYYTLIPFLPDPKGGSYPVGWGHLLRPINEAINTTLNQMFDAGHLQTAGGGFVGTSLSLSSGPVAFTVGKYIPVNNKGMAIRDAVFPLPFQGPSPVLFQLLGVLMQAGKEVASIQDILTGEASLSNQPPTTILALIEQGMKLYTAINKRIFRAFKQEYAKLFRLNRKMITEPQRYKLGDEWQQVSPQDYKLGGGVEPIADPTMVTDMQKVGRAAVLMQFLNDPLINQIELRRRFLDSVGMDRIPDLLVTNPQMGPADQLKIQEIQAQIGRQRAAEMKDTAQAMLFMAQMRGLANDQEVQWIEKQLDVMRLHVEAANTMVKAADVELKSHDRRHAVAARNSGTKPAKDAARNVATTTPSRVKPAAPDWGPGVPDVASYSPNQGVPSVPQGPGPGLPPGGDGSMGTGQPPTQ